MLQISIRKRNLDVPLHSICCEIENKNLLHKNICRENKRKKKWVIHLKLTILFFCEILLINIKVARYFANTKAIWSFTLVESEINRGNSRNRCKILQPHSERQWERNFDSISYTNKSWKPWNPVFPSSRIEY